jgi:heme A synthase
MKGATGGERHFRGDMITETHRSIAVLPVFLLAALTVNVAWAQAQQALPNSPSSITPRLSAELQNFQDQSTLPQQNDAQSQQSTQSQQASGIQKPVGTAAAEVPPPSGVAVSNSAGAAIAPAKQKRVRTLVIGMAAILGAGAAIGAVAALSSASPSRPPGAH